MQILHILQDKRERLRKNFAIMEEEILKVC